MTEEIKNFDARAWSATQIGEYLICDVTKKACFCKNKGCEEDCDFAKVAP